MTDSSRLGPTRSAGVGLRRARRGKRNALTEALATSGVAQNRRRAPIDESRGEPAFCSSRRPDARFRVEGLGTKSIIAASSRTKLGVAGYTAVALRHGRRDRQRPDLRRRAGRSS